MRDRDSAAMDGCMAFLSSLPRGGRVSIGMTTKVCYALRREKSESTTQYEPR